MHTSILFFNIAALIYLVAATNTTVNVGLNAFTFSPSSVNGGPGDFITFVFHPTNHSLTQSTFKTPCQPLANGIDSGFVGYDQTPANFKTWTMPINDTNPTWFFCAQTGHCGKGMVFSINPGNGKKDDGSATSADEYLKNAQAATTSSAAPAPSKSSAARALSPNTVSTLAAVGMVFGFVL